jgi:hypothetical protein
MGNQACCTGGANNGSGDFDHFHYAHSYNRRNHNDSNFGSGPRPYPKPNYPGKEKGSRGRNSPGAGDGAEGLMKHGLMKDVGQDNTNDSNQAGKNFNMDILNYVKE